MIYKFLVIFLVSILTFHCISLCKCTNKGALKNGTAAIIILGKGEFNENNPYRAICDEALKQYDNLSQEGYNTTIIPSDDKGAEGMKTYLQSRNPKVKVIPEKMGYDTLANAFFSEQLCRQNRIKKVVIVVTKNHSKVYNITFDKYFSWKFRDYDLSYAVVNCSNDSVKPNQLLNKLSQNSRLVDYLIKTRILGVGNYIVRFWVDKILPLFKSS